MPAAAVPAPQAPATPVAPAQPAAAPAMETPSPQTVPSQAKQSEYDPAFPFDEWETPTGPWALDDLLLRVSEHNRLVAHGRRLLVRNEDILQAVKAAAKQDATPVAEVQDATPEKPGEKVAQPAKQNQQFFGGIPINNGTHDGEEEAGYESKPFHKKKLFPVAVAAILLFVAGAGITYKYKYALRQHFGNKKDTIAAADTTQPPPLTRTEDTAKLDNASDAAQAADEPGTNDKKTGAGKNGSGLSPLPNMEVAKSEAISFSREGVRDKSLPELTNSSAITASS